VERAEHVLVEEAVLAARWLSLGHVGHPTALAPRPPCATPQTGGILICRYFQGQPREGRSERVFARPPECTTTWSSSPEQPATSDRASLAASPARGGRCARSR